MLRKPGEFQLTEIQTSGLLPGVPAFAAAGLLMGHEHSYNPSY
jgi:hypothetical protein